LVGFQFGAGAVQSYSHAASTGLTETLKKYFNAANIDTFFVPIAWQNKLQFVIELNFLQKTYFP